MLTRFVAAACALGLGAAPALAAEFAADGTAPGRFTGAATPVGETLVVLRSDAEYAGYEMGDPAHPMASLAGPCHGTVLLSASGAEGGGLCHQTDADGEVAVIRWTATGQGEGGRVTGDWALVGGTGKWDGASGGGGFDAGGEGEDYANRITGEITLP